MAQSCDTAKQVIQGYIRGTFEGDVSILKGVFHDDAHMAGFIGGEALHGSPQSFFDAIAGNPSAKSSGSPYKADITHMEVVDNVANATLVEKGLMGLTFINYFQLMCEGGKWQIVSKVYTGS